MKLNKRQKIPISHIALKVIGATGLLAAGLVVPNVLGAVAMLVGKKEHHKKSVVVSTIKKLENKKLVEFKNNSRGQKCVTLTEKGIEELNKYKLKEYVLKLPFRWDKKWRVLIFDIKEGKRRVRDQLRRELSGFGFVRLQDSVWVYPYECNEYIVLLKSSFKIGKEILYLVVESIENDRWLKKEFGLD